MTSTEFSETHFDAAYPAGVEEHYWNRARNQILAQVLQKNGLEKKRILEIGCGRGVVLGALRDGGFDCYGVELAPVGAIPEELRGYLYGGTDFASLEPTFRDSVEVIMLLDVIEHLDDPEKFLMEVRQSFRNAKSMIITVPARMELWSNYDEYYGHKRRYVRVQLDTLMRSLGFSTVHTRYFFHALYLPALLLTRMGRQRGTSIAPPKGFLARYVHRFIAWCFCLEYRCVQGGVRGTSLLSLGRFDGTVTPDDRTQ